MVIPTPSRLENLFQGGYMVLGRRRSLKKAALTILLSAILILALIQPTLSQEPGKDFETAPEIDLSTGSASLKGSLIGEFEDNHYYKLMGLSSGMKIKVSAELIGMGTVSGFTTIALYSEKGARLVGSDQALGRGEKIRRELTYILGWIPENPNPILYLRIGKSRGALNYTVEISVERVDDAGSGRDAGIDPSQAIDAPEAKLGEPAAFTGYLAGEHLGDDHIDCYKLKAVLEPKQILRIIVEPSKTIRLKASLLSADKFPLRNNESKARGMPITLQVKGDWLPGTNTFYLTIDNMDGRGGEGTYTVRVEVLKPLNQTTTTTAITTAPGTISEEYLKYILIGVAVALVVIAAIILILRRRRGIRVVETGEEEWWGGGWEEGW